MSAACDNCVVAQLKAATCTDTDIHTTRTYSMYKTNTFRIDSLWAGRSGDRIPVRATFAAKVQTGPGTLGPPNTRSLSGDKAARVWR